MATISMMFNPSMGFPPPPSCGNCKSTDLRMIEGFNTCYNCGEVQDQGQGSDFQLSFYDFLSAPMPVAKGSTVAIRTELKKLELLFVEPYHTMEKDEFLESIIRDARDLMDDKAPNCHDVNNAIVTAVLQSKHMWAKLPCVEFNVQAAYGVGTRSIHDVLSIVKPDAIFQLEPTVEKMFGPLISPELIQFNGECKKAFRKLQHLQSFKALDPFQSEMFTVEFYFVEAMYFLKERQFVTIQPNVPLKFERTEKLAPKFWKLHKCLTDCKCAAQILKDDADNFLAAADQKALWEYLVSVSDFAEKVIPVFLNEQPIPLYQAISGVIRDVKKRKKMSN